MQSYWIAIEKHTRKYTVEIMEILQSARIPNELRRHCTALPVSDSILFGGHSERYSITDKKIPNLRSRRYFSLLDLIVVTACFLSMPTVAEVDSGASNGHQHLLRKLTFVMTGCRAFRIARSVPNDVTNEFQGARFLRVAHCRRLLAVSDDNYRSDLRLRK